LIQKTPHSREFFYKKESTTNQLVEYQQHVEFHLFFQNDHTQTILYLLIKETDVLLPKHDASTNRSALFFV
jgi:hypothetical protein